MLRIATKEDIPTIVKMGMKFASQSNYKDYVDENTVTELITNIVSGDGTGSVIIMYDDVGMLIATSTRFLFGSIKLATDVAWWVEPEARNKKIGLELVQAFEHWAKLTGCKIVSMTCLDDAVAKLYEKNGYTLYERSYFKEL